MRSPLAFKPDSGGTTTRAVTNATARVALPGPNSQVRLWTAVTDANCFVAFGDSTVTAATTDMPFPAGSLEVLSVPINATHIAAITSSGTATLYVTSGQGL